jgi:carbon monoxide dehydrogenase subunit G
MNLQGDKVTVNKSNKDLFEFLTDTANFKTILPDNLDGFEVAEDSFKFSTSGMPSVRMVFAEKTPYETVKLKADNDMFPVFLTCRIAPVADTQCEAQLFFEGEVNMMVAMMIKKPLQNLLDVLTSKMATL